MSYLDLTPIDLQQAKAKLDTLDNKPKLDQYRATSIAGNAVWGSVYYSSVSLCRKRYTLDIDENRSLQAASNSSGRRHLFACLYAGGLQYSIPLETHSLRIGQRHAD